ncbi:hypothetical protein ABZS94_34935 [Streptomyces sp. NPDC005500]|uniref:hypothetical protein n=1 Tax=Streptomyces sp. NPDC005500 TaxID=3155007 RepID=UPI0033B94E7B
MLWADVLGRATGLLHDVECLSGHSRANLSQETVAFWLYLDTAYPNAAFDSLDEEQIGALYVEFQQQPVGRTDRLPTYLEYAERDGWMHPSSVRILQLWETRLAELGVRDLGLREPRKTTATLTETLQTLVDHGLCLDHRPWKGPVYLDVTSDGLPLRQLVSRDGQANYLAYALSDLVPLVGSYDELVLACDRQSLPDYEFLKRVLVSLGASVSLLSLGRVAENGSVRSSRHRGGEGLTAASLSRQLLADFSPAAFRLGLRLYFIACLGQGDREPFRMDLLRRCTARAERLLDRTPTSAPWGLPALLYRHAHGHSYVNPYGLTASLLSREGPALHPGLLKCVFL